MRVEGRPEVPSSVLTSWWGQQSDPDRIELYTRWTFYLLAAGLVPMAAVLARSAVEKPWFVLLVLLFAAQGTIVGVACSQSLEWELDRREKPRVARTTNVVFSLGLVSLLFTLYATDRIEEAPLLNSLLVLALAGGFLATTICLTTPLITRLVTLVAVGVSAMALLATGSASLALHFGLMVVVVGSAVSFSARFSVWMLAVVRELDEARHIQARLAVAEERLRFARDLHDVLGRNLSVIALKSELAVQLAQRQERASVRQGTEVDRTNVDQQGKAGAAVLDQLVEVQRIARESQGELREVVRGYRDTGLRTELAGARGVLRAAGVDCQVSSGSEAELSTDVQTALGWVVREATTNVLRHSDASHCAIELDSTSMPGMAVLTVTNDGVRADGRESGPPSGGTGLAGLRERLARVGGELTTAWSGVGMPPAAEGTQADGAGLAREGGTFTLRVEVPVTAIPSGRAVWTRKRSSGE